MGWKAAGIAQRELGIRLAAFADAINRIL